MFFVGNVWPHGQAVKTTPSHGVIRGSIPRGVTIKKHSNHQRLECFIYYLIIFQKLLNIRQDML